MSMLLFFYRNQTSLVNLQLLTNNKKVEQVVYGREYTLRADITHADGKILISSKAKKTGIIDRVAAVCKKKQRSLILTHLKDFLSIPKPN